MAKHKYEVIKIEEKKIIRLLKKGELLALEAAISKYGTYVTAVVKYQLGSFGTQEDVEELSSDVFTALWRSRKELKTEHLRGYLGAVARNRARDFLRRLELPLLPLEDYLSVCDDRAQQLLEQREQRRILQEALELLTAEDREIFLRYYYYNQRTEEIATAMLLNHNTVKSRLKRGREKLKITLTEGGYLNETGNT